MYTPYRQAVIVIVLSEQSEVLAWNHTWSATVSTSRNFIHHRLHDQYFVTNCNDLLRLMSTEDSTYSNTVEFDEFKFYLAFGQYYQLLYNWGGTDNYYLWRPSSIPYRLIALQVFIFSLNNNVSYPVRRTSQVGVRRISVHFAVLMYTVEPNYINLIVWN